MNCFFKLAAIGTEQAIPLSDALKALGLLGLAAFIGPLVIGGLVFTLKKGSKKNK